MKIDPDRSRVAVKQLVSSSTDYQAVAMRMVQQLEREIKLIHHPRSPFSGRYAIRLEVIPVKIDGGEE